MPDTVAITAGSGTIISTDEVAVNGGTTAHVQHVKLVDGASNGTDGIPGTTSGLGVVPRPNISRIQVTSGGLTTSVTAYSAGDQVGAIFEFTNAARVSGGCGYVTSAVLLDETDIIGAYDLVLFDRSVTLASDNAAFAISDADAAFCLGIVQLIGAYDIGNNRIAQAVNVRVPYCCNGTSLFGALIARGGHTFFGATTSLKLALTVERN